MRIVCPYTAIHPLCVRGLAVYAPAVERVHLNRESDAYWRLLVDLFADRRDVLIIEHDVEIHSGVVPALEHCPEPWCAYEYRMGTSLAAALGCVRFRSEILSAVPLAASGIGTGVPGQAEFLRAWQGLDGRLASPLLVAGFRPHVHRPPVRHHHLYEGRCACGVDHEDYPVDVLGRFVKEAR